MTAENDIVLIYMEDQPLSFARIEGILPDSKPDWYHVRMLLLQVPLQVVTWLLRDVYIDGTEFTMQGKRMRLEKVEVPEEFQEPEQERDEQEAPTKKKGGGKLIAFGDLKKD